MINNTKLILFVLTFISINAFSQTETCTANNPYEEKDGLLTIEMESGTRSNPNWKIGTEADPNLPGSTISYLFWDGNESFSRLSNAQITYNIKINNPGTYRFLWRGRIGFGDSRGEHNDAWLRIVADDFFAERRIGGTLEGTVEPTPNCNTNSDRECPEGAKVAGYFKAFMNVSPTNAPDQRWRFVTNTNDGVAHNFIKATFNEAGNYSIIVDARSSFFFIDKMVLFREGVSGATALNLSNPESACVNTSLSVNDNAINNISVYPNPSNNKINITNLPVNTSLVLKNVQGAIIRTIKYSDTNTSIDISNLANGIYFISSLGKANFFAKKIIKN